MASVDDIISGIFKTVILKAVIAAIVAAVPFLGTFGINIIVAWVVEKVGTLIITALAQFIDFTIIDWKTDAENSLYKKAVSDLKAAQASGEPQALEKARNDFHSTLSNLVRIPTA